MIGSFLSSALALALGYAYPAYECYKTVELNKPEIDRLRFWCQYWILVAALTVFERAGEGFISWVPMYSEAKVVFFVFLWYPKTRGTAYVYETFFRPYVVKHETDIDRNLIELRTRAGDMAILYSQRIVSYGQTRVFEILQYVASQSTSQPSRSRATQQPQQARQATHQPAQQLARPPPPQPPASPTKKTQLQETMKAATPSSIAAPVPINAQPESSSESSTNNITPSASLRDAMAMRLEEASNQTSSPPPQPPPQEKLMEETVRVTRARLRKSAVITPAGA